MFKNLSVACCSINDSDDAMFFRLQFVFQVIFVAVTSGGRMQGKCLFYLFIFFYNNLDFGYIICLIKKGSRTFFLLNFF
jgi:hypothetical protein